MNLNDPHTLNEKIAWLKLYFFNDFYIRSSDKYLVHNYLEEKLGFDYAPKLLFVTQDPDNISLSKIGSFPCIMKVSNGSGANLIISNKEQYSEQYLRSFFKMQLLRSNIHTITSLEHQYEIKRPYIVVEELLQDNNGNLPNDYKFLYINGKLAFIYCSVDRMGQNVRQIYDNNWKRKHFIWVEGANEELFNKYESSTSIPAPKYFQKMKDLSSKLAADFPLVRIDFYETESRVYIGEITLHHGSGHDIFYPEYYDRMFGDRLVLPLRNRY